MVILYLSHHYVLGMWDKQLATLFHSWENFLHIERDCTQKPTSKELDPQNIITLGFDLDEKILNFKPDTIM